MTTAGRMEQTTLEANPSGQQPIYVHSHLWKRMIEKFLKGEPKVLGVVQIVIALLNLSISILMMSVTLPFQRFSPISVYIGYPIWGAVMFISSGSFSIAAAIRTTKGLVRSSLGLNITSSLFAFAGMVIGAVSTVSYSSEIYFCKYRQTDENCAMNVSILLGLDVVVVVLSALQFCVTISVSAFGCKVICCNNDGVVVIMPSSPPMAAAAPPSSFQGLMPPAQQETSLPENLH